jgi:hypothetical protein
MACEHTETAETRPILCALGLGRRVLCVLAGRAALNSGLPATDNTGKAAMPPGLEEQEIV